MEKFVLRPKGIHAPPLRNFDDVEKLRKIRKELFPQYLLDSVYPPNTLLVVDSLYSKDILVEIEAVAVTD